MYIHILQGRVSAVTINLAVISIILLETAREEASLVMLCGSELEMVWRSVFIWRMTRGVQQGAVWAARMIFHRKQDKAAESPQTLGMCHSLMSWDSDILASVFFTRSAVSRDAGLWAQHSVISLPICRRHWTHKHTGQLHTVQVY